MKQQSLEQLKKQIVPILKNAGITRAAIFGSTVRGENTEKSDVDILINVPDNMSLFDLINLEHNLEDVLKKKVDLVDSAGIKTRLKPYIMKDQVSIL